MIRKIFILLLCLLLPSIAGAHRVNVFAYAERSMVYVEGYFVDGTKAINAVVSVYDTTTGKKLLEGKTDKEGRFSFPIKRVVPLKIVLYAGMGHRSEIILKEKELLAAMKGLKSSKRDSSQKGSEPGVFKIVLGIGLIIGLFSILYFIKRLFSAS